ncbi:nuclease-related domain-containing protein [Oryzomicrobium sp.]|uniref:nuclease-related domain-containing protein n=1 Tax=Oryzomicrobium sp. TaxID=1911578 RepID=UPI002FE2E601
MLWQVLMVVLGLVPVLTVVALVYWKKYRLDADERREALTTDLRRLPGASLQAARDELLDRQMERVLSALLIGLAVVQTILSRRVAPDFSTWSWFDTILLCAVLGSGVYYGRLIMAEMPKSRRLRQAIRAEQATAQEIAVSLAGDNHIFHDIQAEGFNIDHVVITPAGVFAIETKSRMKPPAGNGAAGAKVQYDGKQLRFPCWTETEPIEQASRQAKWLSTYLKNSTGELYQVIPVLALPGWFVVDSVRPTGSTVRVVNPKNVRRLFLPDRAPVLDTQAIQRAAFQLGKLVQAPAV